jgi:S1-C subfamily serine protease
MSFLRKSTISLVALAVVLVISKAPAKADDLGQTGRAAIEKWQSAIVNIQVVMKLSMTGDDAEAREMKAEANGTVIDPSGLIVMSLSDVQPDEEIETMMRGDSSEKGKVSTNLTDIKIRLSTGQEIPAKVVLRDKDLDLAFIAPKVKSTTKYTAIDLTKSAKASVLDQFLVLHRLGSVVNRTIAASSHRIVAQIDKPRTFYIPDVPAFDTPLGTPAIAVDGNPIGIMVVRVRTGSPTEGQDSNSKVIAIILPCEDVLDAAKQALESTSK